MKSFEVEGISYRSISEFCRKRKVSYWKMRRLCRTYIRAHKDPAVAAKWILNIESLKRHQEPLTIYAIRDRELSKLRGICFRSKKSVISQRELIKRVF